MNKNNAKTICPYKLSKLNNIFTIQFDAMASPCEILIETQDSKLATHIANIAVEEVIRIERKFSRYIKGNLCYQINNANGKPINIDEECFRLLSFGQTCYEISDGLFDLTSGILRRAWSFNRSSALPSQNIIDELLPNIGWHKINFTNTTLKMQAGMEIDFGGIGKEYAVSKVAQLCQEQAPYNSILVNLGGDIQITSKKINGLPWYVGVENPACTKENSKHSQATIGTLSINEGALATSGDSKRYILHNGKRYGHILNPKTGWPIKGAPSSITVAAPICIQAGCLSTIALLNGNKAQTFLDNQGVKYWCSH